jgi:hypothetical protein
MIIAGLKIKVNKNSAGAIGARAVFMFAHAKTRDYCPNTSAIFAFVFGPT